MGATRSRASARRFAVRAAIVLLPAAIVTLYFLRPVSAATVTWTGATSTDWHTGSNWNSGIEPGPGDDVVINNVTNAPVLTSARTIHSLTINSGETVTLNNTLTMNGSPTAATLNNNGTLTGSGTLRTQNTVSISNVLTSDVALNVNTATTTINPAATYGGNITIDPGATLSLINGLTHTGDLTNNGTLSGGTFEFNGSGKTVTNNGSITCPTFHFNFAGAKNLAGAGTWTNTFLQLNNAAAVTLTSDVTISATNFSVGASGGGSLDLGGRTLTLSGVNFTSTTSTTVSNGTLRMQGTTSMNVTAAATFTPAVVINTGTTIVNSGTFDVGSSITIDNGATLVINLSLTHNGDLTNNGILSGTNTGAAFDFSGTDKTVTNNGSITIATFRFNTAGAKNLAGAGSWTGTDLQINNGAAVTLTSDVTIAATNFRIDAIGSGSSLNLNGFILTLNGVNFTNGVSGTVTGTGTFRTQGTTIIAIAGLNFTGALEVNSGTTTVSSSTISGSITINPGATMTVNSSNAITHTGDLINNGTLSGLNAASRFDFNGVAKTVTNNGSVTIATFRFNTAGAKSLAGTGSFSGSNTVQVNNGAAVTLTSNHQVNTLTVDSIGGGTMDITNQTLSLSGSGTPLTVNATGTLTTTGSTIVYNGTAVQTVQTVRVDYHNLTTNNAAGVTLSTAETVPGTLTLMNGVFSIGSNLTMAGGALIRRSDGSLSGTPNFGVSINVEYFGANAITTGTELPASSTVLNNLTLNNTNTVTLANARTANGTLSLNSGSFSNGANLTLASGANIFRDAGTLGAAPSFGASASVTYTGTTGVTTGPEIPSASSVLNTLEINKAGGVTLGGNATVNGSCWLTSGVFSAGSSTLTLNNGTIVGTGSLASGPTGTVIYNQSSDGQVVLAANYANLTFSNFNKTLPASGTVRIAGAFTPGTAPGHTIAGSTVEFNGTVAQTLPAGFTIYNNLTANNPAGISLSGNITVNGALTLANGNLDAGANTLSLTAAATSSRTGGHVLGNLKKTFGATGSFVYHVGTANGYSPVNVTITAGSGDLTIKAVQGAHPALMPAKALQRYWTLTGAGLTADLQMSYLDPSDVMGNEAIYRVIRLTGGAPFIFPNGCPAPPCVDAAANTATLAGVTSFADFTAGEPTSPTAVKLESMMATGYDDGTLIEWQTGTEVDNLGFNLYREEDGKRVFANRTLIAGSALKTGATLGAGESYAWWDSTPNKNAGYWLEDVDLSGRSTWHGPFYAKSVGGSPPARSQAALLHQLGQLPVGITQAREKTAPIISAAEARLPSALASQPAVKITVKREGVYRVTQPELLAAGLAPQVDPRFLQLFVDGQEVPIAVLTNQNGQFDESSAIEFYGYGVDTPATDARTYWLIASNFEGKRIIAQKGEGGSSQATSFIQTVERKDRLLYFAALRNGEEENFFGAVITSQPVDQIMNLQQLDVSSSQEAILEIALQGVTQTAHRVSVQFNGNPTGLMEFGGQTNEVATFILPQAVLQEGANTVRLVSQDGAGDVSLVDAIRISYPHTFTAENNRLQFTARGGEKIAVGGFRSKAIRVFDVTIPDAVHELIGEVQEGKLGDYSVTVASRVSGERRLLALTQTDMQQPALIKANQPSELRAKSNAADLLIITTHDFFSALEPLKLARQSEGYRVTFVDIEDVYDEFSFGNKAPQAVRDFLACTQANWQLKPRFLLLAGDASYDARNYLGWGEHDLVPTKLLDTTYLETASDDWFADFDHDGVAEMAVGRLPIRTPQEAATLVAKLLRHGQSKPADSALLVSDENDGFNFEQASAQLHNLIPADLQVEEIKRGQLAPQEAKRRLVEAFGRGQTLINYFGHGSVNLWRGNLLSSDEALQLRNERLPVLIIMNCLNGYFQDADSDSLGEALLKAENGGAIAVWASSGMVRPQEQSILNQNLYRLLFDERGIRMALGEAVRKAKASIRESDLRRTWILLGDPTLCLRE